MRYRFHLERYNTITGIKISEIDAANPVNWADMEFEFKRSEKYGELLNDVAAQEFEFEFPNSSDASTDGFTFLRNAIIDDGLDADVRLSIYQTPSDYAVEVLTYTGQIDFATYAETTAKTLSVSIMPNSAQALLIRRDETKVDLFASPLKSVSGITLDASPMQSVLMTLHSKAIKRQLFLKVICNNGGTHTIGDVFIFYVKTNNHPYPNGLETVVDDNKSTDYSYTESTYPSFALIPTQTESSSCKFTFYIRSTTLGNITGWFFFIKNITSGAVTIINQTPAYGGTVGPQVFTTITPSNELEGVQKVTVTFTLAADAGPHACFFSMQMTSTSSFAPPTALIRVALEYATFTEPTQSLVTPVYEALDTVVRGITEGLPLYSEFYGRTNSFPISYPTNGCGSFLNISTGQLIRQFPGQPFQIDFKTLFESLAAKDNVACQVQLHPFYTGLPGQIKYVLRVEPLSFFYDRSTEIDLGAVSRVVSGFSRTVNSKAIFSNIKVGYGTWTTEELLDRDEINSKREFTTQVKNADTDYTIESKIIGSATKLEITRRQPYISGKEEKYRDDNSYFFICASRVLTGGQPLLTTAEKNENFTSITDVYDAPSTYNLRATPPRMLVRHLNKIGVGLLSTSAIKQTYYEGSTLEQSTDSITCAPDLSSLSAKNNGVSVITYSNEPIFGRKLHDPYILNFSCPFTQTNLDALRDRPTCVLKLTVDGTVYTGFIKNLRYKPNNTGYLGEFELLEVTL